MRLVIEHASVKFMTNPLLLIASNFRILTSTGNALLIGLGNYVHYIGLFTLIVVVKKNLLIDTN